MSRIPFVVVFLLSALAPAAVAQRYGLDWMTAEWQRADRFELPENMYISFTRTEFADGSADDLAALEAMIAGKPDHPKRREAETLRRKLEHGGDVTTWRLWYESDDRYRIAQTFPEGFPAVRYNDVVVDGDRSWRMTNRGLHLLDMDALPENEHPRMNLSQFQTALMQSIWPGFGSGSMNRTPSEVRVDSGVWLCEIESESPGHRWVLEAGLTPDGPRIGASRVVEFASNDAYEGGRIEYGDWGPLPVLDRPAAFTQTFFGRNGVVQYEIGIVEVREIRAGELDSLLVEPSADSTDPIRGRSEFAAVYDLRGKPSVIETGLDTEELPKEFRNGWLGANAPVLISLVAILFVLVAVKVWKGSRA